MNPNLTFYNSIFLEKMEQLDVDDGNVLTIIQEEQPINLN